MWLWIVLGVVAVLVVAGALGAAFSGTRGTDGIRRSDPEQAARLEMQQAEHGQRGVSGPFGGAGGI